MTPYFIHAVSGHLMNYVGLIGSIPANFKDLPSLIIYLKKGSNVLCAVTIHCNSFAFIYKYSLQSVEVQVSKYQSTNVILLTHSPENVLLATVL